VNRCSISTLNILYMSSSNFIVDDTSRPDIRLPDIMIILVINVVRVIMLIIHIQRLLDFADTGITSHVSFLSQATDYLYLIIHMKAANSFTSAGPTIPQRRIGCLRLIIHAMILCRVTAIA